MAGEKISSGVNISGGSVQAHNIAGRDVNVTQLSKNDINSVFQPVAEAICTAGNPPEALGKLENLKEEASKGKEADHGRMAKLIDGIVELVPGALKALGVAFAAPVMEATAGPVSQFLLRKMLGQ